jgi:hypothetical protein
VLRGGCRPLQPTRPTPSWHRRQAMPPAGFGLLPVRSPLLRESSLFLGVLRCFSSPGALSGIAPQVPGRAPGGLPHSDIPGSPAASASPGHFAAWPRPSSAANAKASTMRPSCGYPATVPSGRIVTHDRRPARASGMVPSGRTSCRVGPTPPGGLCVFSLLYCMVRVSARGRADTSPRRTRSGATADSGQARPTRVRTQGLSPSPAAAEPHGFRVAPCQSADDPRAVVATTSPSS